jgi:hypothetical protein
MILTFAGDENFQLLQIDDNVCRKDNEGAPQGRARIDIKGQ